MKAIDDLFLNVADFRKYVPGISANIEFEELNSSAISARKQICNIITKELWKVLKTDYNSEARHYLCNAFGNLIMFKSLIFDIVSKRTSQTIDIYKQEYESMRRQYIDNYYNAMDSLIEELSSNGLYSAAWQATHDYKMIDELKIKSTTDFNGYYGIDLSYLFFFRTIPLQREILIDGMKDVFEKSAEREDLTSKLKFALSQLVVALALSRFDIIELPSTIRSLFDEQKTSRSGSEEQNRIITLAAELRNNAISIITAVELALSDPVLPELVSDTSFNTPDDKIYLIS